MVNSVKGTVTKSFWVSLKAEARVAFLRLLHEVDGARVAVRDLARLGEDEPEQRDGIALGGQPHPDGVELAQLHPRARGLRGEAQVLEGLLEGRGQDERCRRPRQKGVPRGGPAARGLRPAQEPDHRHEAGPGQCRADGVGGVRLEVHHQHLGIVGASPQALPLRQRMRLVLRGQRLGQRRGRGAVGEPDELPTHGARVWPAPGGVKISGRLPRPGPPRYNPSL
jgi:hypothetical protein